MKHLNKSLDADAKRHSSPSTQMFSVITTVHHRSSSVADRMQSLKESLEEDAERHPKLATAKEGYGGGETGGGARTAQLLVLENY
jgi:hypothetical protein